MEKDKASENYELNHIAFDVAGLDEVLEARAQRIGMNAASFGHATACLGSGASGCYH